MGVVVAVVHQGTAGTVDLGGRQGEQEEGNKSQKRREAADVVKRHEGVPFPWRRAVTRRSTVEHVVT